jgi:hypothetical protein
MEIKKINLSKAFFFSVMIVFVFFYLLLNWTSIQTKQFNSPDETANYYFLERLAESNEVPVLQKWESNAVHPRSTLVWRDSLVPVSFTGFLYIFILIYKFFGIIGVILTLGVLLWLFYCLWFRWLKDSQSKKLAIIATILLFFNPALFYYALHPFYHNFIFILFAFLGIIFYFRKKTWADRLASVLLIFALWVRPIEIIWLLPLLISTWIYLKWGWKKSIIHLLVIGITSLTLFALSNYLVYGDPILFGYILPNLDGGMENDLSLSLSSGILFNLKTIILNVRDFFFILFWPWAALLVLSLITIIMTWARQSRFIKWNVISWFMVSSILFVYYGSWSLNEHIVSGTVSIGNSFVRYWLPVYLLSIPFIAYLLALMWKFKLKYFVIAILIFLSFWSINSTFFEHDDSFYYVNQNLQSYIKEKDYIKLFIPEENSVVVIDREDKILFPYYAVMHMSEFRNVEVLVEIAGLLNKDVNVFYYGFTLPERDMEYLHREVLPAYGYCLVEEVVNMPKTIYKFRFCEHEE